MPDLSGSFNRLHRPLKVASGIGLFALLYLLGTLLPPGFDWNVFFGQGRAPEFFVPWVHWLLPFLTWPMVVALTLIALGWAVWQRKGSPLALLLTLSSLPVIWTLSLGQLDGLALLGLNLMPGGVALALLKPQLTTFAMFASRRWLIAAAIVGVLSLIIWGPWPLTLISRVSRDWKSIQPQDISLFPWSIPFVLPRLWLSRGDADMLMAAGSLMTPLLIPYHLIVVMPSIARIPRKWQIVCWLLSWLPLSANWLGPLAWRLGNIFSIVLWIALWRNRNPSPANDA